MRHAWFLALSLATMSVISAQCLADERALSPMEREKVGEARSRYGFEAADSVGLFVGINKFQPGINELHFAADDAVDLAHLFWRLGLIEKHRIRLGINGTLSKKESGQRLEELLTETTPGSGDKAIQFDPTKPNVLIQLRELKRLAKPNGIAFITFSTHGYYTGGEALIMGDTIMSPDSTFSDLDETALSYESLRKRLDELNIPRKIMLIDACREKLIEGATKGSAAHNAGLPASVRILLGNSKGTALLLGTSVGGYGYDGGRDENDREIQNGVFTYYLMQGIDGEAELDDSGVITLGAVADYTGVKVAEWVNRNQPEQAGSSAGISPQIDTFLKGMPLATNEEGIHRMEERKQQIAHAIGLLDTEIQRNGTSLPREVYADASARLQDASGNELTRLLGMVAALGDNRPAGDTRFLRAWYQQFPQPTPIPTLKPKADVVVVGPATVPPSPTPELKLPPKVVYADYFEFLGAEGLEKASIPGVKPEELKRAAALYRQKNYEGCSFLLRGFLVKDRQNIDALLLYTRVSLNLSDTNQARGRVSVLDGLELDMNPEQHAAYEFLKRQVPPEK